MDYQLEFDMTFITFPTHDLNFKLLLIMNGMSKLLLCILVLLEKYIHFGSVFKNGLPLRTKS